jgi:hypothetical protein
MVKKSKSKKAGVLAFGEEVEDVLTLKGIVNKKSPPAYINIDGHIYERLENGTSPIGLDFDTKTAKLLSSKMKEGGYVNHQEVIREALRALIKTL